MRARYYDPASAQFVSGDPIVASTRSPYAYVLGNPLNGTDPTGLGCWPPWSSSCQVDLPGGNCIANGAPTCSNGDTGVKNFQDNVSDPNPTGFIAAVRDLSAPVALGSDIGRSLTCSNVSWEDWAAVPLDLIPGSGFASGREISVGDNFRFSPLGNWGAETSTGAANWAARVPHYHRRIVDPVTGNTVHGGGMGRHRPWQGW
jgi:hypothetical protein